MSTQGEKRVLAQANADYFRVPFVCFFDTSGNYRTERYDATLTCHEGGQVFLPREINLPVRRKVKP